MSRDEDAWGRAAFGMDQILAAGLKAPAEQRAVAAESTEQAAGLAAEAADSAEVVEQVVGGA